MIKKIKGFLRSKSMKVGVLATGVASALGTSALAADDTTVTAMTSAFSEIQGTMLSGIGAIAPIALVVVGAVLLWKFGIKFFKSIAK